MTPPGAKDDSSSELKVLHIDLTSFVPSWFWKADFYTVEAVTEGLVCISNDSDRGPAVSEPGETRFCVLNPLTRTCKVMPQFEGPFDPHGIHPRVRLQPTPAALTIFSFESEQQRDAGEALVATYDLAGSGGTVLAAYRSIEGILCTCTDLDRCPMVAMCAGETYLYDDDCKVRVLVPGPGGRLVEAAVLEQPSLALLGLDPAGDIVGRYSSLAVSLVVLRGSLLYVESFRDIFFFVDGVMGVWRLARERLEWEAVARLNVAELKRLTGLGRIRNVRCHVRFTYGVREFLYCIVNVNSMRFTLGLNLDTGEWELVPDEQSPVTKSHLVELRPDVFL